jgi:hypothetical protein
MQLCGSSHLQPAMVVVGNEPWDLRCCYGNMKEECVFLRDNCPVLSRVERDVYTARQRE